MRKRIVFGSGLLLLAILVTLVVWQGSFSFGPIAPSSVEQTYVFWAVSTLIFLLTVTLVFMLFRTAVKLYIERQDQLRRIAHQIEAHRRRARAQLSSRLFPGPVERLGLERQSGQVFGRPGQNIKRDLINVGNLIDTQVHDRLTAEAHWLASLPAAADYESFCRDHEIEDAQIENLVGVHRTPRSSSG